MLVTEAEHEPAVSRWPRRHPGLYEKLSGQQDQGRDHAPGILSTAVPSSVTKHWNKLPREVAELPSTDNGVNDGALGSMVKWWTWQCQVKNCTHISSYKFI